MWTVTCLPVLTLWLGGDESMEAAAYDWFLAMGGEHVNEVFPELVRSFVTKAVLPVGAGNAIIVLVSISDTKFSSSTNSIFTIL